MHRLTPLLVAAYNGVTEAAEWLLSHGACPDAADCYHVSALMKASYFGHASTVRALLTYGANSSCVDMYGAGALAKAAYRGHTSVVRLLLAAGARTDGEDLYGNRPLHSAVASGHRNIAMMLLQYGGGGAKRSAADQATAGARSQRRSIAATSMANGSGMGRSGTRGRPTFTAGSFTAGSGAHVQLPIAPALLALSS